MSVAWIPRGRSRRRRVVTGIFWYVMVRRNQYRIEERAGKAGKRQAVPGATQAAQDGTTRIAHEIDDQIEALASYVAEQLPLLTPCGMARADNDLIQQRIALEHARQGRAR